MAYRIKSKSGWMKGHDDDGDRGCGLDVTKVLEKAEAGDVVVVVTCYVVEGSGSHNRFRHIVKACGGVLDLAGFSRSADPPVEAVKIDPKKKKKK
jgi:hypothetical protein